MKNIDIIECYLIGRSATTYQAACALRGKECGECKYVDKCNEITDVIRMCLNDEIRGWKQLIRLWRNDIEVKEEAQ